MTLNPESTPSLGQRSAFRQRGSWRRKSAASRAARPQPEYPAWPPAPAPAPVESGDALLAELEEVLVAELRLAQTIDSLTDQERFALEADAPDALAEAVRAKLTCLGELARLEPRRDAAVAAWARRAGLPDDTSFDQLLRRLEPALGQRLGLFQLGVEAHLEHCRALRPANRALAFAAVARHADWRHFLLRQAAGGASWPSESA